VVRSFNLNDLLGSEFGANEVEIAVPIFFRRSVKEILSIGKSVNLVRYLNPQVDFDGRK
jgi:hypothetical protein